MSVVALGWRVFELFFLFAARCAAEAHAWFKALEKPKALEYYPKSMTRIKMYGKWHDMSRDMTAYGDPGTSYTFSSCKGLSVQSLLFKLFKLLF